MGTRIAILVSCLVISVLGQDQWIGWGDNSYNSLLQLPFLETYDTFQRSKLDATNIKKIFANVAGTFFVALTNDDDVYSWGDNSFMQLGFDSYQEVAVPTLCPSLSKKNAIGFALGTYHGIMWTDTNTLYTWGLNVYGQLGRNPDATYSAPGILSPFFEGNIIGATAGGYFSILWTDLREVFGWGTPYQGEFGPEFAEGVTVPTPQSLPTYRQYGVIGVVAAQYFTLAWTSDGYMYAFGSSPEFDISGLEPTEFSDALVDSVIHYVTVDYAASVVAVHYELHGTNNVSWWGAYCPGMPAKRDVGVNGTYTFVEVESVGLKFVRSYQNMLLVMKTNGVYDWLAGCEDLRTLFLDFFPINDVVSDIVVAGSTLLMYSQASGETYLVGDNSDHQFGLDDGAFLYSPRNITAVDLNQLVAFSIAGPQGVAIDAEGQLVEWGTYHSGLPYPVYVVETVPLPTAAKVYSSMEGALYMWDNTTAGAVYAWGGYEWTITLGRPNDESGGRAVLNVMGLDDQFIVDVKAGVDHAVFLTAEGDVYACGYGWRGATGVCNSDLTVEIPQKVEFNGACGRIVKIAVQKYRTYVIDEEGQLCGWGYNSDGGFGNGLNSTCEAVARLDEDRLFDANSLACGADFIFVNSKQGETFRWGGNGYGQLCDAADYMNSPTVMSTFYPQIFASEYSVILYDGEFYFGCGESDGGQLIDAETITGEEVYIPYLNKYPVRNVTAGYGFFYALGGGPLPTTTTTGELTTSTTGDETTTTTGEISTTTGDSSTTGEFTTTGGFTDTTGDSSTTGDASTTGYTPEDEYVWFGWGDNSAGSLLQPSTHIDDYETFVKSKLDATNVKKLYASPSGSSFLALKNDGTVYVWGNNDNCKLGTCTVDVAAPLFNPVLSNFGAVGFALGEDHGILWTEDNAVYSWGSNYQNQLGRLTPDRSYVDPNPGLVNTSILSGSGIRYITATASYSLLLAEDGSLYGWGFSDAPILGSPYAYAPTPIRIPAFENYTIGGVESSYEFCVAWTTDGKILSLGYSNAVDSMFEIGQLDNATIMSVSVPTTTSRGFALHYVTGDGSAFVVFWGSYGCPERVREVRETAEYPYNVTLPFYDAKIRNLGSTDYTLAIFFENGTFITMGCYYQNNILEDGANIISNMSDVVIRSDGSGYCTYFTYSSDSGEAYGSGDNRYKQLGLGDYTYFYYPVNITIPIIEGPVGYVALGGYTAFATSASGDVVVRWGGTGEYEAPAALYFSDFGLENCDRVYTTDAFYGDGATASLHFAWSSKEAVLYSFSDSYGVAYLLGRNVDSELGPSVPGAVDTNGEVVLDVVAGAEFVIFLTTSGNVYAFGSNDYCQLGDCANYTDGSLYPVKVEFAGICDFISQICANSFRSYALDIRGQLCAWGYNGDNTIGVPQTSEPYYGNFAPVRIGPDISFGGIACGLNSVFANSNDWVTFRWGTNSDNQLCTEQESFAVPTSFDTYYSYIIPSFNTVLLYNGSWYGCGSNDEAQLMDFAQTGYEPAAIPALNSLAGQYEIVQVFPGKYYYFALAKLPSASTTTGATTSTTSDATTSTTSDATTSTSSDATTSTTGFFSTTSGSTTGGGFSYCKYESCGECYRMDVCSLCYGNQPLTCAAGKCSSTGLDCPSIKQCSKDAPFLSYNGECYSSALDARDTGLTQCVPPPINTRKSKLAEVVPVEGAFLCWDGSCASSQAECDALINCPVGFARCYDGSCSATTSGCKGVNTICGDAVCPDGTCTSPCAPYNGCNASYSQCFSGQCVKDVSTCNSKCEYPEKPYECYGGYCVGSYDECDPPVPPYAVKPERIAASLCPNVQEPITINVVADVNDDLGKEEVLIISIPVGVLNYTEYDPCELQLRVNPIADSQIFYRDEFPYRFLSPLVSLNVYNSEDGTLIRNFEKNVTLNFTYIAGFYKDINSVCLAYLDETQNKWTCQSDVILGPDGSMSGVTDHFSVFGVMNFGEIRLPKAYAPDPHKLDDFQFTNGIYLIICVWIVCISLIGFGYLQDNSDYRSNNGDVAMSILSADRGRKATNTRSDQIAYMSTTRLKTQHTWLAIFFPQSGLPLNRTKRAVLLFCSMMGNMFIASVFYDNSDGVGLGMRFIIGIVTSLIVFPSILSLSFMFKKLPQTKVGIAYTVSVIYILGCTFCAIWWNVSRFGTKTTANQWIQSWVISAAQDAVIMQPFKILTITLILVMLPNSVFAAIFRGL